MSRLFKEILIEHTSLHSLQKKELQPQNLMAHTRELFKFVENVLLADVVWICNTVTPKSMIVTNDFVNLFAKHGLSSSRADGKFRIANFTSETISIACKNSAPAVFDGIKELNIDDLRKSMIYDSIYQLRPSGAQEIDYSKIKGIPYASSKSEEYVLSAMQELGWGPISCMPLLNSDLYNWFTLNAKISPENQSAYLHFNALCRWRYNEELAQILSSEENRVQFVPSFGRAIALNSFTNYSWNKKIDQIQKAANSAIQNNAVLKAFFSEVGSTFDYPLPLLGMWAVSKLPNNPSFSDLIDKISELQDDPEVQTIKNYILTDNTLDLTRIQKEIIKEIGQSKNFNKNKSDNSFNAEGILKIPILPFQIKVTKKIALDDIKQWSKSLFMHKLSTILTGFISNIIPENKHVKTVYEKAYSILLSKSINSGPDM